MALVPASTTQELYHRYRGVDADSPDQRRAVARYVGLEMPEVASPLPAASAPDAYRTAVSKVELSELQGLDYVKAQLYGVDAVVSGGSGGVKGVSAASTTGAGGGGDKGTSTAAPATGATAPSTTTAAAANSGGNV